MLFSIITVCFNSAKTIRQTFESILSQSCKDYEYWVIDGASTDGTVDIIREYEPRFEGRMHWLSEPDKGIYDAMNKGIRLSQGEYLNFMNSDDYFEPEALQKTKEVIQQAPGYGIYFGAIRELDANDDEIRITRNHPNRLKHLHGNIWHQGLFEKRELFPKYNYYSTNYRIVSDLEHFLKLYQGQESFYPLDFCVASFRRTGISSTKHMDERMQMYINLGLVDKTRYLKDQRRKRLNEKILHIVDKLLMVSCKILRFFRLR